MREELLNLTYEVGPQGVRVLDKGKVHQDHAVCLRGIAAMLAQPERVPQGLLFVDGADLDDLAARVAQAERELGLV